MSAKRRKIRLRKESQHLWALQFHFSLETNNDPEVQKKLKMQLRIWIQSRNHNSSSINAGQAASGMSSALVASSRRPFQRK